MVRRLLDGAEWNENVTVFWLLLYAVFIKLKQLTESIQQHRFHLDNLLTNGLLLDALYCSTFSEDTKMLSIIKHQYFQPSAYIM